jgi:hypothetical protein
MRQTMLLSTFLMLAPFMLTAGCISSTKEVVEKPVPGPTVVEKEVIVKDQPPMVPTPRVEIRGVPPSPDYVWAPGYWDWNGREWVWISGKWTQLPYPNAAWVPGHWEWNGHEWIWVSGYWRQ